METLTIEELQALLYSVSDSYWNNGTDSLGWKKHGMTWLKLMHEIEQRIKDLQFEQEQNPLPFPEK